MEYSFQIRENTDKKKPLIWTLFKQWYIPMLIYAYITISEAYLGSCQRSMTNNVFAKGSIKNIR